MVPVQPLMAARKMRSLCISFVEPIFGGLRGIGTRQPMVEEVEARGEWFVRAVEEDQELTGSFELDAFALVFAES